MLRTPLIRDRRDHQDRDDDDDDPEGLPT
jgi:hypothetical protein